MASPRRPCTSPTGRSRPRCATVAAQSDRQPDPDLQLYLLDPHRLGAPRHTRANCTWGRRARARLSGTRADLHGRSLRAASVRPASRRAALPLRRPRPPPAATARSNIWDGSTTRSKFGASASSWERSRPRSPSSRHDARARRRRAPEDAGLTRLVAYLAWPRETPEPACPAAAVPARTPARLHGAGGVRAPGRLPLTPERQARPQRAARRPGAAPAGRDAEPRHRPRCCCDLWAARWASRSLVSTRTSLSWVATRSSRCGSSRAPGSRASTSRPHLFEIRRRRLATLVAGFGRPASRRAKLVTGAAPLTPIQQCSSRSRSPNRIITTSAAAAMRSRAPRLCSQRRGRADGHHDALRQRFRRRWRWMQCCPRTMRSTLFERVDLSAMADGAPAAALEARARPPDQSPLRAGPCCASCFPLGAGRADRLLIAIHHLAVDGVSWRILLDDLQALVAGARDGEVGSLPPKTASYQQWAHALHASASSSAVAADAEYWLEEGPVEPPPRDGDGGENTVASARTLAVTMSATDTRRLLHDVPGTIAHASKMCC